MITNPRYYSKLTDSTKEFEDGVDFLHSGLVKSLSLASQGNYVVSGCNVTQTTGSPGTNFAVATGVYHVNGTRTVFTGGGGSADADLANSPHPTAGYDWYALLVITGAATVAIRETVGGSHPGGLLKPKVCDYTAGDVIVGVIKVEGGTGANSVTRPFQFLTHNTDSPIALSLKEASTPTAESGYGKIYVKSSDSLLYFQTDGGAEHSLTAGGTFTISDGSTTQGVASGDTLTFAAGTGLDVAVSATDTADVSDFLSNGTDNYIVTATGTDAMNAEANFTFTGSAHSCTCSSATFISASASQPVVNVSNTANDATAGMISFTNSRTTANQADDDTIGTIQFRASDSAATGATIYSSIVGSISDVTNTDEGGKLAFNIMSGGIAGTAAFNELFTIGGEDVAAATQCEVVVNEAGIDCDFRVESNTNTAMLKVDALGDRVGINSATLLSGFNIGTSFGLDPVVVTASTYTVGDTTPPFILGANVAHAGGMVITFPDPSSCEGRIIVYYTTIGSAHNITLDVAGGFSFNTAATLTPNSVGNLLIAIAVDAGASSHWLELVKNF